MRLTEIILINNDSLYVINEKKKLVYKVFPDVPAPTPTDADTPLLIIDSKKSHGPLQTLPQTIDVGRVIVRPLDSFIKANSVSSVR